MDAEVELGVAADDAGDYAKAKTILLPLAEQGHPKAMNIIGYMHNHGHAFSTDPLAACQWYKRSADAGHAPGMYNLSICYHDGIWGAPDPVANLYWLTLAADKKVVRAMLQLAELNENEPEGRRIWLNKASDQGSQVAKYFLWLDGYGIDAPDFGLLDELCLIVRISILKQDIDACDP